MWTLIIQLVLSDPSLPICPLTTAEAGSRCAYERQHTEARIEGFTSEKQCLWELQRWVGVVPEHNRTAEASELHDLPSLRRGQQWLATTARCEAADLS